MPYYQQYSVSHDLRDYVKCVWVLEDKHPLAGSNEYVTLDSSVELIFNLGDPCVLNQQVMPPVFLVGLQDKPLLFRAYGLTRILGVRCHLWGALPIFHRLPHGLEVLGGDWLALAADLAAAVRASGYSAAVGLLNQALAERLTLTGFDPLKQVQAAGQLLYASQGQLSIAEVAYRCGLSSRQLQRQFNERLGISPKTLARTIRFEQISRRLYAQPNLSLLDLTYEFGYSDQAHFVKDFKAFALKTPGEFARLPHH